MINVYKFNPATPLTYSWAGKFESPNSEWMHLTRQLFDFELMVVTEGTLYIADADNEYKINKGEYLLMGPTDNQHGYKAGNCSFYWLHFFTPSPYSKTAMETEKNTNDPLSICVPEKGTLKSPDRIIILMKQLQDSDRRYGMTCLNNYLTSAILSEISGQSTTFERYSSNYGSSQLISDINDYINWNICNNLKVGAIAQYFGYNEKYISILFKKHTGISIKQFILQTKMEHAKAELSDTNNSISQIAYSIGYSDPHNFTNAFKKVTGLTPSEFRESYSKRKLYYE